jgi:hydrogenase-1 operon protein HyaE
VDPTPFASPDLARLLTLYARLVAESGFEAVNAATVEDFVSSPGESVLFFAEDPKRIPETWDLAVVLPEVLRAAGRPLRVGLLDPPLARALATRYGVSVWPSLVFLRDGAYLGALERMRNWDEFGSQIPAILALPPSHPPASGMPPASVARKPH